MPPFKKPVFSNTLHFHLFLELQDFKEKFSTNKVKSFGLSNYRVHRSKMQSNIWNSNLEVFTQPWHLSSFIPHQDEWESPLTSSVDFGWGRWCSCGLWLTESEPLQESPFPGISDLSEENGDETWHSQKVRGKVFVLTPVCLNPDEPNEK